MGAYLHIGFVVKATCKLPDSIAKNELLDAISGYYGSDTFDVSESMGKIAFTLNAKVIQKELPSFVHRIYEDYYGSDIGGRGKTLEFIKNNTNAPDWLEKVEEANFYDFSPMNYAANDRFEVDGESVILYTTVIRLGSEGKFLMEECGRSLHFMETCAHQAYSKFRLGKTFRVFVL